MKTKMITILLVIAMIVLSFAQVANAATTKMSVTADKTEVNTGDTVVVTIHSSEKTPGANFLLEWNRNFLEYVESDATADNPEEGRFEFVMAKGLTEFNITFKVKGTTGSDTVKVTPVSITVGSNEDYEVEKVSDSVKISIKKAEEKPTNTTTTNTTTKPANTTTTTNKKPDRMPQTGFNVAPIIGVAALVIVASAVIRRRK